MAKFWIPYRTSRFDRSGLSRINASLSSIEHQLRAVPQELFSADRTLFIPPAGFAPAVGSGFALENDAVAVRTYYANVDVLNKSTVTSIKTYWYRDDAVATGACDLKRSDFQENEIAMATANSNVSTGFHNVSDTSISNASLDYDLYMYYIKVVLTPNAATTDVRFQGVAINYTVQV